MCTTELKELHDVCKKLTNKGVVIVSAFDNLGVVSYPAAFKEVIGVYWDVRCKGPKDYFYVENSPINILGYANTQRLPWLNDTYKTVSGSSFIAPYITIQVVKNLQNNITNIIEIMAQLKKMQTRQLL